MAESPAHLVLGDRFFANETQQIELKHLSLNSDLLESRYGPRVVQSLITMLCERSHEEMKFLCPHTSESPPTLLSLLALVKPSLETSIDFIFPKYLSCFCNAKCNGTLYIGVSDDLEITGIPVFPELTEEYLRAYIDGICEDYVCIGDGETRARDLYDVEIIEVETDMHYLSDDIESVVRAYSSSIMEYNDSLYTYREEYQNWTMRLHQACGRLINIVNTSCLRKELIAYIKAHKEKWTQDTDQLVTHLERSEYVHFDTNYEQFGSVREDPSRIWYWVTRYKEDKVRAITDVKPRAPDLCCRVNVQAIVSRLSDLRYRFAKMKVKYAVIKITFRGAQSNEEVAFRFPRSKSFQKMRRGYDAVGEPCSIPM